MKALLLLSLLAVLGGPACRVVTQSDLNDKESLISDLGPPIEVTSLPLGHERLAWHAPTVWSETEPSWVFVFDADGRSVPRPSDEELAVLLDPAASNESKLEIMRRLNWVPAQ